MSATVQTPRPERSGGNRAGASLRVLLTNNATLNTGDAAIMLATMRVLRRAFGSETQFTVCDKQPDIAARYYPEVEFRAWPYANAWRPRGVRYVGRLLRALNRLRQVAGLWAAGRGQRLLPRLALTEKELADAGCYAGSDLVVSTGGTYLVENYSLEAPIFDYRLTQFARRPLILFTQSLGPFTTKRNIEVFRTIFNRSQLILLRDERSRRHLDSLDLNGVDVRVSADTAFALADEAAIERARVESRMNGRRPRVAISVRHWPYFTRRDPEDGMERYRQAVGALTAHLVEERGAEVTFLSTCQGVPEYWTDDSLVAREVVDELPAHIQARVTVDQGFHRPEELLDQLAGYDLAVSTRMHFSILALSSGVPVLPISYEFKTQELFARLGVGDWVQDIEDVTDRSLPAAVDGFLEALPDMRGELFSHVLAEHLRAVDSGAAARQAFERWHASA